MIIRFFVLVTVMLFGSFASACGGPVVPVGLVEISLFILVLPAYLIPMAGVLWTESNRVYKDIGFFLIYALVGISSLALVIFSSGSNVLVLVSAIALTAPSMHYFLVSIRRRLPSVAKT